MPVIKPPHFELVVNLDCQSDQILIDIVSERGIPSGEWSYRGEDIYLDLHRIGQRGIRSPEIPLTDSFYLIVTFDNDTARTRVTKHGDRLSAELIKAAPFFSLGSVKNIPEGTIWYVLSTKDPRVVDRVREQLKPYGTVLTLDGGYYQCVPWRVSKDKKHNRTLPGYMICVRPRDIASSSSIDSVMSSFAVRLAGRG